MREARRAYSNAVAWIRSIRPTRSSSNRWALRAVDTTTIAGFILLGVIGLLAPSRFGNPGAAPFRSGWPWLLLLALVGLCVGVLVLRWRHLRMLVNDVRRGIGTEEAVEGAAASLASAPGVLRTRFALAWVWGPLLLLVMGTTLAFAAAYFAVDAILARFQIGWEQPVLGMINAALSLLVFRLAAFRGSRLIVAYRAHRVASGHY